MADLEKGANRELAPDLEEAVVQAVRFEFSGPLPHPQVLVRYNEAVPDGAERIVKLAEDQAQHRQVLEVRGQIFTFVLAMIRELQISRDERELP